MATETIQAIHIIGTSHIARQSVAQVRKYIESEKPDIVALELDKRRAISLMQQHRGVPPLSMIFQVGMFGYLFALLGNLVARRLGRLVGVNPGEEMREAMSLARKNNSQLALMDQDILLTLRRLSKAISFRDVWQFIKDIFNSIFRRKKLLQDFAGFDLGSVPTAKVVQVLISRIKRDYPSIYKVLIHERNVVMAHRLAALREKYPGKRVLAVMGAGHVPGVRELLRARQEKSGDKSGNTSGGKSGDSTYSYRFSVG